MNSFLGFQEHMPFMLDPERIMFQNVKLLIYLTEILLTLFRDLQRFNPHSLQKGL